MKLGTQVFAGGSEQMIGFEAQNFTKMTEFTRFLYSLLRVHAASLHPNKVENLCYHITNSLKAFSKSICDRRSFHSSLFCKAICQKRQMPVNKACRRLKIS